MGLIVSRGALVLTLAACGWLGALVYRREPEWELAGAATGAFVGLTVLWIERSAVREAGRRLFAASVGMLVGLAAANLVAWTLVAALGRRGVPSAVLVVALNATFGFLGLALGARKGEGVLESLGWNLAGMREEEPKVLDTSVIIDGRIADIAETRFIEGPLVIPHFVLVELQYVADSSDAMKRTRGRRGLDVLKKIQKQQGLEVRIVDRDFPDVRDVDHKLVLLAKEMRGKLLTTDFNLSKVAEVQGVSVLNINLLANALKPVILPGEMMDVRVIREGKEPGQGVGYLDDGTMVVVDN
ncbi:MAG: hypothetical protein KC466_12140, partial [Myxococcales bacterium]|nr:hypothetical protein [Myxococcales bacterium]